jgi:hypothetical protein
MTLEIETRSPYNSFRGEVSSAELKIGSMPIQIADVRRAEFRPYERYEGELFLEDCVLSFRTKGFFRGKGAEKLTGFVELRIASLQNTVKIPVTKMSSLRVISR